MVDINCDMGEGFGVWRIADDEAIMRHIDTANVACGFHASDPSIMQATVAAGKAAGIAMGAHPGLPDLWGFGRRAMALDADEVRALVTYQVGALVGFLTARQVPLNHVKPHGSLYGMAARDEEIAAAVAEVAGVYDVPVFGMSGTAQQDAAERLGVAFTAEFFADLDYDDDGGLIITRTRGALDLAAVEAKITQALRDGTVTSVGGRTVPVTVETICFHSDTPNALALAERVEHAVRAETTS
jgi:5-oxoprolinase (ATP-hydrolysing) subunit A